MDLQGLQMVSDFHRIDVPVGLPTGEYLLLLDWIFDGKPQFATNVYFTFEEDLFTKKPTHGKRQNRFSFKSH